MTIKTKNQKQKQKQKYQNICVTYQKAYFQLCLCILHVALLQEGLSGWGLQMSVKILVICQLSIKFKAIYQLSVNWLLIIN